MCQALLEIMEPEINQIVRQATEKERREKEEARREKEEAVRQLQREKEKAEKTVIKMIKLQKVTIEEIQECVPKLSIDDIEKLAKSLEQV